jgi:hypothetical protein
MFSSCTVSSYLYIHSTSLCSQAGVATKQPLETTTSEEFMNSMRVNALSCVQFVSVKCRTKLIVTILSCFLAIKYASKAMVETNDAAGKTVSGGSIILTASGLLQPIYYREGR